MKKDFDSWNIRKKIVNENKGIPFFHEREVWWCALGLNIGFEQDGSEESYERPVLILKVLSRNTCFVVPLTTSKNKHKLRPQIGVIDNVEAKALISQIRIIDTKRLVNKIGVVDTEIFKNIRKIVRNLF